MYDYNCPDCNEAKLQSDKNARKINEVIDQVNALIQVNNETVDLIREKINEELSNLDNNRFKNVLKGNYLFVGDSICEGYSSSGNMSGGYARFIAEINSNMTYKNIGISGATLCNTTDTTGVPSISTALYNEMSLNNSYDHIILEGGINDAWNIEGTPLGSFDKYDLTSELDITTICGTFENMIRQCLFKWPYAFKYFLIPHIITPETSKTLFDTLIEICEKYAVIVIDLREKSGLFTAIPEIAIKYTDSSDSLHPNADGYRKYYIKPIIDILSKYQKEEV